MPGIYLKVITLGCEKPFPVKTVNIPIIPWIPVACFLGGGNPKNIWPILSRY